MAAMKSTERGHLYFASRAVQNSSSSVASAAPVAASGAGSITAFTCSPQSSSGMPKTAASATAGCVSRTDSTSAG